MVQISLRNKSQKEQDNSVPLTGSTSQIASNEGGKNTSERADSQMLATKRRRKETTDIALGEKRRNQQIIQKATNAMPVIFSPLPTPAADTPTHHLSTNTEKEPHTEAGKSSSSLADDEIKSLAECELYKNYPRNGFMTGYPLFNNLQEAYDVYDRLTNYERN
eukprot:561332-Ditylum_brightwellii.AAC.1